MAKALKRLAVLAILLAAVVAYILIARRQFEYPWLYVDLRAVRMHNVLFFGGALLLFALGAVFAIWLLFNAEGRVRSLALPLLAFAVLIVLSGYLLSRAVDGLPCTYTQALSAYETQFSADRFKSGTLRFCPQRMFGTVTGYVYYENGDVRAEKVSVRCATTAELNAEQRRLESMGLESFTEDQRSCYTFRTPLVIWQVLVDREEELVTYSRFDQPSSIPTYMPQPAEPTPEEPRPSHGPTAPTGGVT